MRNTGQDLDAQVLAQILSAEERVTGKKRTDKPKTKSKAITLGTGEKFFSEVFGFKPLSGIDHAVRVFDPKSWDVTVRSFIPVVDPDYVFQPNETEMFVVALMAGDKIFLHGPKGTGKSTMPEQVAARLGMPFACVNGRRDLETSELLGKLSVDIDPKTNAAHTVWHDGPVTEMCRYGGLFVKDEISLTPSGVNTSLQKLLEDHGKLYIADMPGSSVDKTITPHPWFRFVATDNTALQGDVSGKYASTLVQDESLLDRFDTVVFMDYLDRKHEVEVIAKRAKLLDMKVAEDMVSFAQQVRQAYKQGAVQFTMSIRGLIKWANKVEYWGSTERVFYYSFVNKLIEDDQKIVGEMYVKVFGKDPTDFSE